MISPEIPKNEENRLKSLESFSILDTLPEKEYDEITDLAALLCDTPISLITFVDKERQWFKSHKGLDVEQTKREFAFCAHAINNPSQICEVKNALDDERFYDNPLVTGNPNIRFYAGAPLITKNGQALGTLCVIDTKPKQLSKQQKNGLKFLANKTMRILELRRSHKDLENSYQELEKFAHIISHDIKGPLGNIDSLCQMLSEKLEGKLQEEDMELITHLQQSSSGLKDFVDEILKFYLLKDSDDLQGELIDLDKFFKNLEDLVANENESIEWPKGTIETNNTALNQIMLNLLTNAFKYNYSEKRFAKIDFKELNGKYHFSVADNGIGIDKAQKEKVFKPFETLSTKDRNKNTGTGLGMATVQKLIKMLEGHIDFEANEYGGTTFQFSVKKLPVKK